MALNSSSCTRFVMTLRPRLPVLLLTLLLAPLPGWAQVSATTVEAESGARGGDFTIGTESGVGYVTITTNAAGQNPGSAARVITFTVTFPAAGTYDLYARIRVGAGTFDDDSFFYGNGFGTKTATVDDDWILTNQLSPGGWSGPAEVVTGEGAAGAGTWKWINLSAFNGGEAPPAFTVPAESLTQSFQIGAREDGLQIDKFAFGPTGVTFTVTNLDQGEPGSSTPPSEPTAPDGPPLAAGKSKYLGSAYNPGSGQALNFEKYWNQVVPENAGKWGSVEAVRDVMNWADVDAAHDFARTHGFPFRYHVLVWGNQQPAWIESLPPAEQLAEIEEWFGALAERYPDLELIEVVNEPIHDAPDRAGQGGGNYLDALGGTGATGWDWVINAFRLGRLYFPNARLMINEYSVTNDSSSAATYARIIRLLKAEGLIDAVGIQGHAFSTTVSAQTQRTNLNTIAATGLPLYITELDIDGGTPAAENDAIQLANYQRILPVFWEHPSVHGLTLWGYRPGLWRSQQAAYLVRANETERPALQWLRNYVQSTALPPVFATVPESQSVPIGGTITLSATLTQAGPFAYQWRKNGVELPGATAATLTISNASSPDAGVYSVAVSDAGGTSVSPGAVVGIASTAKVMGDAYEFGGDIFHPVVQRYFDQILLTGTAATITADPGQVTRMSYLDLNDDIVQVEFAGPGALTLTLAGASGPAVPVKYNQPTIQYMKGHATIVLTGATEETYLSVFSVGRGNGNPAFLFEGLEYDGVADIRLVALASPVGRFGGVRTANVEYFGAAGLTGLYAPDLQFTGPVYVHNVSASDTAAPVLLTGPIGAPTRVGITGGDLLQPNAAAIAFGDAEGVSMLAGTTSHSVLQPAQANQGTFQRFGQPVESGFVQGP